MSHVHESHCNHDIRLCEKCDKCYCAKCSKEWGNPICALPHYWTNPYPTWPGYPIWTTTGAGTGDVVTTKIFDVNSPVTSTPISCSHTVPA